MKTLFKIKLKLGFLVPFLIFYACHAEIKKENTLFISSVNDTLIKNNEIQKTDSVCFLNEQYKITSRLANDEPGEIITVFNLTNNRKFQVINNATYYVATIDSFLITDNGTGNIRELSILNLNTLKEVFTSKYVDEVTFEDKQVLFKKPANKPKSTTEIYCNPELLKLNVKLGFVNLCKFDFSKQKIIATNKFECYYFE